MKGFGFTNYGKDNKVLEGLTIPSATGLEGVVRIKVHAASFNPIDFGRREGKLKMVSPDRFPAILGYDASGVIDEIGANVTDFKIGDEVYVRLGGKYAASGSCAEYVINETKYVAKKPKNSSFVDAAAYPLAAITAMQMLERSGFKSGDSVFISGGGGGVGHLAIQIAKAMGASRVVSSASAPKHSLLKKLGADDVIDYKSQKYTEVFADRPFDIGLDCIGETYNVLKVVKKGGTVISIVNGITGDTFTSIGAKEPGSLLRFILWFGLGSRHYWNAAAAEGVIFNHIFLRPNAPDLDKLTKLIEDEKVKVVTEGNVFEGIESAPKAMALLEGGRVTGKVSVKII